ncbi:MAG: sterol desaturase, partial [Flavobacterium sp.]
SVAQVLITLLFVTYLFDNIAKIGLPAIFIYGFFILVTIYSYSELMDKSKYAALWEGFRFVTAIGIISYYGDWFGLNTIFPFANYVIMGYLILSLFASLYFVSVDFKTAQNQVINS